MIRPGKRSASSRLALSLVMSIREDLRTARKNANLTTYALAERLNLTQGAISGIENGHSGTRLDVIERWLAECGYVAYIAPANDEVAAAAGTLSAEDRDVLVRLAKALPAADAPIRQLLDSVLSVLEERYRSGT